MGQGGRDGPRRGGALTPPSQTQGCKGAGGPPGGGGEGGKEGGYRVGQAIHRGRVSAVVGEGVGGWGHVGWRTKGCSCKLRHQ